MIPKIEPVRNETNLTSEAIAYTVTMTPTLAKILSSQTYTDKILAAIREPLSNAYDSHIRAGSTRLAELHLPTQLEPWFAIRDYGTGLSHENVIRLFFSYNVSDKRDTNNEIGGLGIGAKAFYAYTDICTITVWYDGEVRRYAATKSKDGLPQGQLVETAYTDQANGIEIRYPVQPRDFNEFHMKTAELLRHLKLDLSCNKDISSEPFDIFYSGTVDGIRIDRVLSNDDPKLIMGGIAYNIPYDIFQSHARQRLGHTLGSRPLHIHMPIGSVEVSASRESLSPTQEDKDKIVDLVEAFNKQMKGSDWDAHIAKANGWLQACRMRNAVLAIVGTPEFYKGGNAYSALELMQWRDMPTIADFKYKGGFPVAVVYNKGRKVDRYITKNLAADHYSYKLHKVFWMPKNVNWKRWYMDVRKLGKNQDIDLHIRAETMEEAIKIANLVIPGAEVLDGNDIHIKANYRKSKSVTVTPSQFKGMAWIDNLLPQDIGNLNSEYMIMSTTENHDILRDAVERINSFGIFPEQLHVFRPYGVSEKTAVARFPDMPLATDSWLYRHRKEVNRDKLVQLMKQTDINSQWKQGWVDKNSIGITPKRLKFPVPSASYLHIPQNVRALVTKYPGIDKEMEAIQKWHDTVLPTLPEEVKRATQCEGRYFTSRDIFNLYQTLGAK